VKLKLLLLGIVLVATSLGGETTSAEPSSITRVSVDNSGNEGNGGSSAPTISADGRYVAFDSSASNLVPGDTNGDFDIFVHDRHTSETTRVSVDSAGKEVEGTSEYSAISADGRYVAYSSDAANLVPGDRNQCDPHTNSPGRCIDIFIHDRETRETTLVSVDSVGNQGNSESNYPAISADGRYVAFESKASNLVAGDTNGATDVFVHDRETGQTTRVSIDSAGNEASGGSWRPDINADGRYVAFMSLASNLTQGDTNTCETDPAPGTCSDIFVHDRQTGETTRVSVDSAGNEGNHASAYPAISADGRFVAFMSLASNLTQGDTIRKRRIFVHDRQTKETRRVSEGTEDPTTNNCGSPAVVDISAGGRYVAFTSIAEPSSLDLPVAVVTVRDLQSGATDQVEAELGRTDAPSMSADGRSIAFVSMASNLVQGDTNNYWDILAHETAFSDFDEDGAVPSEDDREASTESNGWLFFTLVGIGGGAVLLFAASAWHIRRRRTSGV
jgi:Tol biopolymer transport system component